MTERSEWRECMLSVWEPDEHIISGPKVGKKNEEEKGFSHILSLLT